MQCCLLSISKTVNRTKSGCPPVAEGCASDNKVVKLVEMGFSREESQEALSQSQGDLEGACELLTQRNVVDTQPATTPTSSALSSFLRYTCHTSYMYVSHIHTQ